MPYPHCVYRSGKKKKRWMLCETKYTVVRWGIVNPLTKHRAGGGGEKNHKGEGVRNAYQEGRGFGVHKPRGLKRVQTKRKRKNGGKKRTEQMKKTRGEKNPPKIPQKKNEKESIEYCS